MPGGERVLLGTPESLLVWELEDWPASPWARRWVSESLSGVDRGVSDGSAAGVTVLGVDVAASVEVGIVATASPGVGVWFPQASRAVRIAMVTMRNEIFT